MIVVEEDVATQDEIGKVGASVSGGHTVGRGIATRIEVEVHEHVFFHEGIDAVEVDAVVTAAKKHVPSYLHGWRRALCRAKIDHIAATGVDLESVPLEDEERGALRGGGVNRLADRNR